MKPRNHHEKKKQAAVRRFYSHEDLVNMGKTPAEATRMIERGEHWIAENNGKRKDPETLSEAASQAFDRLTSQGIPPAKAAGIILRAITQ